MKRYKIWGFENKPYDYTIIVDGTSADQVFQTYRKIYGYFSTVQQMEDGE